MVGPCRAGSCYPFATGFTSSLWVHRRRAGEDLSQGYLRSYLVTEEQYRNLIDVLGLEREERWKIFAENLGCSPRKIRRIERESLDRSQSCSELMLNLWMSGSCATTVRFLFEVKEIKPLRLRNVQRILYQRDSPREGLSFFERVRSGLGL